MEIITKKHVASMRSVPVELIELSDGWHSFAELYQHRNLLFLAFLYTKPFDIGYSWRSRTHFNDSSSPGGFIVGTGLPMDDGKIAQITYHLPDEYWDLCDFLPVLDKAPEWDGHSSEDVCNRLKAFLLRHKGGGSA